MRVWNCRKIRSTRIQIKAHESNTCHSTCLGGLLDNKAWLRGLGSRDKADLEVGSKAKTEQFGGQPGGWRWRLSSSGGQPGGQQWKADLKAGDGGVAGGQRQWQLRGRPSLGLEGGRRRRLSGSSRVGPDRGAQISGSGGTGRDGRAETSSSA